MPKVQPSTFFIKFIIILLIFSGFIINIYLYIRSYISPVGFVFANITGLVALVTVYLTDKPANTTLERYKLPVSPWVLPLAVFATAQTEVVVFGHTGLPSLVATGVALMAVLLSDERAFKKVAITASIVGVLVAVMYSQYAPSFGNDTWRDATQATQLMETGNLENVTVRHLAYPFPLVSLLYAELSFVAGFNTLWSSVAIGLLYPFALPLGVYLATRKIAGINSPYGAVIILLIPSAVVWSVWYIPQAYSVILSLLYLTLATTPLPALLLSTAVITGHGGVATWLLIILLIYYINSRHKNNFLKISLIIYIIIFSIYVTYTTLISVLGSSYTSIINALIAFLRGEKILIATSPVKPPPVTVLSGLSATVLVSLTLAVFAHESRLRTLAFILITLFALATVGSIAYPALVLVRYLGFPSNCLAAALAPIALHRLRRRLFSYLLLLLVVFAFLYSAVFMPGNRYTTYPYTYTNGLIAYHEKQALDLIAPLLRAPLVLVDWRAGAYMGYNHLWVQSMYRGFSTNDGVFLWAGYYGLFVTPDFLQSSKLTFLVLRDHAVDMVESISSSVWPWVMNKTYVFSGPVRIFLVP